MLTQKVAKPSYQSVIMDKISTNKVLIGVSISIDIWLKMLSQGLNTFVQYQRGMTSWQEITPVWYHWRLLSCGCRCIAE